MEENQLIQITRSDALWSYAAQFMSIGSGMFVLPVILNRLSTEEIGFNYILLTLSSLAGLFDFGFSGQFGRNFTYVFSGVKKLQKEGVEITSSVVVDYHLLAILIATARYLYRRLSMWIVFLLSTVGSIYVYRITNGFMTIPNIKIIWFCYILSVFFNIYFSYYNALLYGKGLVKEAQQAVIVAKITNILISILLLLSGIGLLSIILANLISPFVSRYIAYIQFYTPSLKQQLSRYKIQKDEIRDMFDILWFNARKMGLVSVGSWAISQAGLFLSGLYLSMEDVASYGLLGQIVGIISAVSATLVSIQGPYFAACRAQNQLDKLLNRFATCTILYYCLFIVGILLLVIIVPYFLQWIHSNATLPSVGLILLYALIRLLDSNHSNFASVIISKNSIPFVKAALLSGFFTIIGLFMVLSLTNWSLWGVVVVPGIVQGVYQNWKWPKVVCQEFNIQYSQLLYKGILGCKHHVCRML